MNYRRISSLTPLQMFKKFFLLIISLMVLSSCTNPAPVEESKYDIKDPKTSLRNVDINTKTTQILFNGTTLSFDLELERPDLKLNESDFKKDMALTVDLPIGLQPRLMYLVDPDTTKFGYGSMCDRPRFPHRCETTLEPNDTTKTKKFLVQIVFEDDTYAEKIVAVHIPDALPSPDIIFPTTTPAQNENFRISFRDIGADKYDVSFRLCYPYENDGINPCFDGDNYQIIKEDQFKLKLLTDSTAKPTESMGKDIITINSMYPIIFQESVNYTVVATKIYTLEDNTKVYVTSENMASFPSSSP